MSSDTGSDTGRHGTAPGGPPPEEPTPTVPEARAEREEAPRPPEETRGTTADGATDEATADEGTAAGGTADEQTADEQTTDGAPVPAAADRPRRKGNPKAAALIGVLCLLLGFAIAVQVRNTGTDDTFAGAREEDLVGILDQVTREQDQLRQQLAEQRALLQELTTSGTDDATALQQARARVDALGILNGTVPAHGPGLVMTIRDPEGSVRVADVLDVLQELRNAGAETMQIDGIRVGVSSAVTGDAGSLQLDGQPLTAPFEVRVIGSPEDLQTAMNIPGGVVSTVQSRGGSVDIRQVQDVVVDALRPLDQPQYAAPQTGGG